MLEHNAEGAEWNIPLRQVKSRAGLFCALTGNREQRFFWSISVPLCWIKGTKVKIGKSQLECSVFHLVVKSFCLMHSLAFEGGWLQWQMLYDQTYRNSLWGCLSTYHHVNKPFCPKVLRFSCVICVCCCVFCLQLSFWTQGNRESKNRPGAKTSSLHLQVWEGREDQGFRVCGSDVALAGMFNLGVGVGWKTGCLD